MRSIGGASPGIICGPASAAHPTSPMHSWSASCPLQLRTPCCPSHLHTQDYSRMGLVERLSRFRLHWNVPPVSGASVFCGVPLPDCAAASLHRVVKCMLLFVWWPSGITVADLLCMKAKEVLHGDDFFHGVLWEDRQCERIQKKGPAGRSVQGFFMIGDWRARSSMVSQVFRRGVPRWRGLRRLQVPVVWSVSSGQAARETFARLVPICAALVA